MATYRDYRELYYGKEADMKIKEVVKESTDYITMQAALNPGLWAKILGGLALAVVVLVVILVLT